MGEPTAKTAETLKGRTADAPGSTGHLRGGATRIADRPPVHRTLLERLRTPRRPRLWFEILLIGVSYWLYSLVRNAVPEQRSVALRHASWIWSAEHHMGLAVEHGVNHALNSVTWLIVGMNYYYATLHFVITIGVLVWLYVRHPERYGPARLVLFVTTWFALVGFWAFPLAPPRLMAGKGFIDTVMVHHTWGSMSQGSLAHVSNQYAAMPSMHIGWSLWCGITLVTLAKPLWARILGALYPLFTLTVIIATGNHFWLDAVGGALCLAVGYALVSWLYGRWVYRLPRLDRLPA
ncbi:phosphatase PAP2 family protein [Actinacidiphila acidipaludis]|uniref:Phosphatase PAP2 family protein n=1 Tax=Actinacidiphila acidipaludis TaxID=2873382 RepID=A0ABS7Q0D8_9ACTN|nr:phosphatase PAP2 family protein [Streptomyces acidipaludis]MBY8876453.1 phosphatase PAP2 family protein [Streptomyces acidipaludis]